MSETGKVSGTGIPVEFVTPPPIPEAAKLKAGALQVVAADTPPVEPIPVQAAPDQTKAPAKAPWYQGAKWHQIPQRALYALASTIYSPVPKMDPSNEKDAVEQVKDHPGGLASKAGAWAKISGGMYLRGFGSLVLTFICIPLMALAGIFHLLLYPFHRGEGSLPSDQLH